MHESRQDFLTDEFDHHFTINGQAYWLPGITMMDLATAASFADIDDPEQKVAAFRDFMVSKVRSHKPRWVLWLVGKSVQVAVGQLNPLQLTRLFEAWSQPTGETSGEASGSQVSTPSTDAS